jgi:hypothetical protein
MRLAVKLGLIAGAALFVIRLAVSFVQLLLAQPQFGGISGFPLTAIWLEAVRFLPWSLVTAIAVTLCVLARRKWRAA